jgi:chromosome segregation ATPase
MTIADRIPALKGPGRRRAQDHIRELKGEVARLTEWQAAADDFFEQQDRNMTALERELADERQARAVAEKALEQAEKTIRLRDQEIDGLKRTAGIRAQAENVITPTQEIPAEQVLALWEARDTGRLGPATNPGHATTR